MHINDVAGNFRKALATNSTDNSYAARPATITYPAGAGVVNLTGSIPGSVPQRMLVIPYGGGSGGSGKTLAVRVIGWAPVGSLWVPTVLGAYDCTTGTAVGVAGQPVLDTENFASTLTVTANMATDGQGVTSVSPQDNTPGHFLFSIKGFSLVEFLFKITTATNANALYRVF